MPKSNIKNSSHGLLKSLGLDYLENNSSFGSKKNTIVPGEHGDTNLIAIYGALAKGLFDGVSNIGINTTPDKILAQINNKPSLIKTLKETNSKLNDLKSPIVELKDSINKIKSSIDSISIEPINVSTPINIDDLTSKLKNELEQTLNDITIKFSLDKSNTDVINILKEIIDLSKTQDINSNGFENLIKLIGKPSNNPSDNSLSTVFTNLNAILESVFKNPNSKININDIKMISNMLELITTVLEINDINIKNLRKLVIITSPGQYIDQIFKNILYLSKHKGEASKNISMLYDLFNSLTVLMDIGLTQRINIKKNVQFINDHIIDSIKHLLLEIDSISESNKDIKSSINNLNVIFDSITKITDISKFGRNKTLRNITFIEDFILPSMVNIINELVKISKDATSEGNTSIENINKLFESIYKLGDFNFKDLIKLRLKSKLFTYTIKKDILGILEEFNKNEIKDNTAQTLKSLFDFYENVNLLIETINDIPLTLASVKLFDLRKNIFPSLEKLIKLYSENLEKISISVNGFNQIIKLIVKIKELELQLDELKYNDILSHIGCVLVLIDSINELPEIKDKYSSTGFNNYKTLIEKLKLFEFSGVPYDLNIEKISNNLQELNKILKSINLSISLWPNDMDATSELSNFFNSFDAIIKSLSPYENPELVYAAESIDNINNVLIALKSIVYTLSKLKTNSKNILNILDKQLVPIIQCFTPEGNIGKYLNEIKEFDTTSLDNIDNITNIIDKIILLSKKASGVNEKAFTGLFIVIRNLKNVLDEFSTIDENNIKKADTLIKGMMLIVTVSATTLLIGALTMKYINAGDLILFTVTLGTFVFGIGKIIRKLDKDIKANLETVKSISYLIGACGGILLLGSIIMKVVKTSDLFLFATVLSAFVGGITFILNKIGDIYSNKELVNNLYTFGDTVSLLCGVLLGGSLLMKLINWDDIVWFIGSLAVFIGGITIELFYLNKYFGEGLDLVEPLYKFAKAVALTGAVLVFGSLIAKHIPFKDLVLFGLELTLFITAVSLPFLIFKKTQKDVFYAMKDFSILVAVSAAIMLIGAAFVTSSLIGKAIVFAIALGSFIIALTWAFKYSAKEIQSSIGSALGLTILVGLSTALLWLGANLVENNPSFLGNALLYVLGLGLFLGIMGGVLYLLGKFIKYIGIGMLAVAGIMTITALGTLLVLYIDAFNDKVSWLDALNGVAKIYAVILLAGVGIAAVGALMLGTMGIGAALLIAGAAAVVGIAAVTYVAAWAVQKMADVSKGLDTDSAITGVDSIFDVLEHTAKRMASLFDGHGFIGGIKFTAKLMAATKIYKDIGNLLGVLAINIQHWANLRIPVKFDKNGRATEFTTINDAVLDGMSHNIETVLTAIGNALVNTVENHKDVFTDGGWFSKSPVMIAVNSMIKMGSALGSIARGVQMWANLRIPDQFDSKGNPTHYVSITEKDLNKLPINIKNVLTAIGKALTKTVSGNQDIFKDGGLFKDSPALVASKAMKLMGETLNLTAKVVGYYATGIFPIFDKNGKKIDEVKIGDVDILMAGWKIEQILTCIGNAIKTTVDGNKEIFNDGVLKDAPAMVAAEAINKMATAINTIIVVLTKLKDLKLEDLKLDDTKEKIKGIIEWAGGILLLFTSPAKYKDKEGTHKIERSGLSGWFGDLWSGDLTVGDYINENLPEMEKAIKGINDITKKIVTVVKSLNELGKHLTDEKLKAINENNRKVLLKKLNIVIGIQNDIYKIGNGNSEFLIKFMKHDQTVASLISKIITVIKKYDEFTKVINDSKSVNKNKLQTFKDLSQTIKNIVDSLSVNTKELNNDHFEVLCNGLKKIYETFNSFEETEGFKSYTKDISNFIEKINSLNLNKLSQMNNLIKSMNELASKMNGMDKLSESIGDKLTLALRELLYQLQKAEASIDNAHKLQEKRKTLINESITKIKKIMNKHMVVEVYNKSNENDDFNNITLNGSPVNNDTASTTSTPSSSPTPELPSPEAAGSTEINTNNSNSWKENGLTESAFIRLMRQHMKDGLWS